MRIFFATLICLSFIACKSKSNETPHVLIVSPYGDIEIELYPKKAPKTVAAFLSYVNEGLYKNTSFYRVLKDEDLTQETNYGIIQGGIWPNKNDLLGVAHESTKLTGLTHESGTVSLARIVAGTATTEFFICIGDQRMFDEGGGTPDDKLGFAAFGKVVNGMDVVRKIQSAKSTGDKFDKIIEINDIKRL